MNANRYMNSKQNLFIVLILMLVCLFFTIPSPADAGGGDSWKRNIYNRSGQTIVLTADLRAGNAWFNDSNENGPFQMAPHSQAFVKYTTSGGMSYGDITVKSQNGDLICIQSWNAGGYYSSRYDRCSSSGGDLVIQ
ncbi:MAG: hypothetical protein M0009_09925 [Deltaproteobacteria bacterium]|nr:hypothetical protein [Deltaproteobacteria bacterium]